MNIQPGIIARVTGPIPWYNPRNHIFLGWVDCAASFRNAGDWTLVFNVSNGWNARHTVKPAAGPAFTIINNFPGKITPMSGITSRKGPRAPYDKIGSPHFDQLAHCGNTRGRTRKKTPVMENIFVRRDVRMRDLRLGFEILGATLSNTVFTQDRTYEHYQEGPK